MTADPPLRTEALHESRTALIVVNYGSHQLLAANLAQVAWPEHGCLVVVVDNWSSAAESAEVRELADRCGWLCVQLGVNGGFGAGVNAGFAAARRHGCDAFVVVNPDAVVAAEVVAGLAKHCRREPLHLVCPTVRTARGAIEFQGSHVSVRDGRIRGLREQDLPDQDEVILSEVRGRLGANALPWLTGACFAVSAELLDRVSGFDESYFLYWEDLDFSRRCARAGAALVLRRDLTVTHDEGGTQTEHRAGRAKSANYYRYNCRNRLLFATRHLPPKAVLRWLLSTPAVSREILLRGGRRQLLQSPRPLAATLRGSLEGAALAIRSLLRAAGDRGPAGRV
ncbi:glycosyltransferase family 2 protein [uncultured Jatrophihabitans sp.]|uniref:glycosyltransferase family 2 protein n=1 Tax=uncultured Jatrophihabitans sp. TaxID=1610747 RepID=UPI0035CC28D6